MTPSDVIAEASEMNDELVTVAEIMAHKLAGRGAVIEDLQRRNALLSGLCSRILDCVERKVVDTGTIIGAELYSRWRKELDELTKP